MVNIITDRLLIRDHVNEDLAQMHKLLSNNEAMHYMPEIRTNTLEESKENLYEAIKESKLENRTKYFFAIIIRETNEYVGDIGYTVTADCAEGRIVNLGYFTSQVYWGNGFVTEAVKAVINYAFTQDRVIKIETGCIKENVGSEQVMKKAGMIKEAELKKHVLLNFKLYDRVEYRLLKEEWKEQNMLYK